MAGRFLVLEGIDASGTTTQARTVAQALRDRGETVLETREPTGFPIGREIRRGLSSGPDAPDAQTLALLFAADRLDHLRREIEPALERGETVICDRYVLSSLAYQSLECPSDWVEAINRRARPADSTIWLRVPVELAWKRSVARMEAGEAAAERFDAPPLQARLHAAYEAFAQDPERNVAVVDGTQSIEAVTRSILALWAT